MPTASHRQGPMPRPNHDPYSNIELYFYSLSPASHHLQRSSSKPVVLPTEMPPKGFKRTTATVRIQSIAKVAGEKRKADEAAETRPTKHQKTNVITSSHPGGSAEVEIHEEQSTTGPDKAFRFLDLPGEIRNQIYEVIAATSKTTFPHTYPSRGMSTYDKQRRAPNTPLPFIGLTQTCVSIRREFRPIWLSTHRFPLFALSGYFKAFFPLRVPYANPEAIRRLTECYHNPAGTLTVRISENWRVVTDMIPILKFRLRFPKYKFVLVSAYPTLAQELRETVSVLIGNTNAMWIQYTTKHIITQVLLRGGGYMQGTDPIRIVIKERHAPDWMKMAMGHSRHNVDGYAAQLGLASISSRISFGVDYS